MIERKDSSGRTVSLFVAAVVIGAGAANLALAWIEKLKSPDRILERCHDAVHELQGRIERFA